MRMAGLYAHRWTAVKAVLEPSRGPGDPVRKTMSDEPNRHTMELGREDVQLPSGMRKMEVDDGEGYDQENHGW
jgi:hypothetical protein